MSEILQPQNSAREADFLQNNPHLSQNNSADETARFMQKVFAWMFVALAISGATAFVVSSNSSLWQAIYPFFHGLLILELVLVFVLSFLAKKVNSFVAMILFILYSFMTGLTLSVVFLVYELNSIVSIFGVTSVIFGAMSLYGYKTGKDLTKIGTLAIFGLLGIIIVGLLNLFLLKNTMLDTILAGVGVLIFIVLTAYDTQKIKEMNIIGNEWTDEDRKEAIIGALTLYLDFINLFLKLLQLFGKRR